MDSIFVEILNDSPRLFPDESFAIAFNIGKIGIRWYAIFFLLGFFVSILIGCYRAKTHYKLKYDFLYYFVILLVPISLLGARFWSFCIGDLKIDSFNEFFTKAGGLAIQGGVVAVVIVSLIYFPLILRNPKYHVRVEINNKVYIQKPSLWVVLDIITPTILIGQAIGRWGNFFNGELFGDVVDPNNMQWLKMIMPGVYEKMFATHTANGVVEGLMYQPLFLYESFINIVCFILIYFVVPNIKKIKAGVIGSSYFLIYGVTRFIMEPLRNDAFNFLGTYILNGILLAIGLLLILIAQFIAPKYRNKQIIYRMWIKYIRFAYIKLNIILKTKQGQKILNVDKDLKKYGLAEKPTFIRNEDEMLYYGPNEIFA